MAFRGPSSSSRAGKPQDHLARGIRLGGREAGSGFIVCVENSVFVSAPGSDTSDPALRSPHHLDSASWSCPQALGPPPSSRAYCSLTKAGPRVVVFGGVHQVRHEDDKGLGVRVRVRVGFVSRSDRALSLGGGTVDRRAVLLVVNLADPSFVFV